MDEDAAPLKAPRLLTIEEACDALRVSRSTIYEMFKAGQLGWVPVARVRRVPAEDIENYVERNRRSVTAA